MAFLGIKRPGRIVQITNVKSQINMAKFINMYGMVKKKKKKKKKMMVQGP